MKSLLDPRLFNVVILVLYAAATVRWGVAGSLRNTLYFGAAFVLNFAVTYLDD